jgi:hypothetical protein
MERRKQRLRIKPMMCTSNSFNGAITATNPAIPMLRTLIPAAGGSVMTADVQMAIIIWTTHGSTAVLMEDSDRLIDGVWQVEGRTGSPSMAGIGALHPQTLHFVEIGIGTVMTSLFMKIPITQDGTSPTTCDLELIFT